MAGLLWRTQLVKGTPARFGFFANTPSGHLIYRLVRKKDGGNRPYFAHVLFDQQRQLGWREIAGIILDQGTAWDSTDEDKNDADTRLEPCQIDPPTDDALLELARDRLLETGGRDLLSTTLSYLIAGTPSLGIVSASSDGTGVSAATNAMLAAMILVPDVIEQAHEVHTHAPAGELEGPKDSQVFVAGQRPVTSQLPLVSPGVSHPNDEVVGSFAGRLAKNFLDGNFQACDEIFAELAACGVYGPARLLRFTMKDSPVTERMLFAVDEDPALLAGLDLNEAKLRDLARLALDHDEAPSLKRARTAIAGEATGAKALRDVLWEYVEAELADGGPSGELLERARLALEAINEETARVEILNHLAPVILDMKEITDRVRWTAFLQVISPLDRSQEWGKLLTFDWGALGSAAHLFDDAAELQPLLPDLLLESITRGEPANCDLLLGESPSLLHALSAVMSDLIQSEQDPELLESGCAFLFANPRNEALDFVNKDWNEWWRANPTAASSVLRDIVEHETFGNEDELRASDRRSGTINYTHMRVHLGRGGPSDELTTFKESAGWWKKRAESGRSPSFAGLMLFIKELEESDAPDEMAETVKILLDASYDRPEDERKRLFGYLLDDIYGVAAGSHQATSGGKLLAGFFLQGEEVHPDVGQIINSIPDPLKRQDGAAHVNRQYDIPVPATTLGWADFIDACSKNDVSNTELATLLITLSNLESTTDVIRQRLRTLDRLPEVFTSAIQKLIIDEWDLGRLLGVVGNDEVLVNNCIRSVNSLAKTQHERVDVQQFLQDLDAIRQSPDVKSPAPRQQPPEQPPKQRQQQQQPLQQQPPQQQRTQATVPPTDNDPAPQTSRHQPVGSAESPPLNRTVGYPTLLVVLFALCIAVFFALGYLGASSGLPSFGYLAAGIMALLLGFGVQGWMIKRLKVKPNDEPAPVVRQWLLRHLPGVAAGAMGLVLIVPAVLQGSDDRSGEEDRLAPSTTEASTEATEAVGALLTLEQNRIVLTGTVTSEEVRAQITDIVERNFLPDQITDELRVDPEGQSLLTARVGVVRQEVAERILLNVEEVLETSTDQPAESDPVIDELDATSILVFDESPVLVPAEIVDLGRIMAADGRRFEVAGHVVAVDGSDAYRQSEAWAQAVADELEATGFERSCLEITGYGPLRPISFGGDQDPVGRVEVSPLDEPCEA